MTNNSGQSGLKSNLLVASQNASRSQRKWLRLCGAALVVTSLTFVNCVACSASEFVFDSATSSNATFTAYQAGTSGPFNWSQSASGTADIVYGGDVLTVDVTGSASADVTLNETSEASGGDYAEAVADANAGVQWRWDGTEGGSPSVTMTTSFSVSGTLSLGLQEEVTEGATMQGTSDAYSQCDASSGPPSHSYSTPYADYTTSDPTTNPQGSGGASFSNEQITFTHDTFGSTVAASINYSISAQYSYQTTAGVDYITANADTACDANAYLWAYTPAGRAWGNANSGASCSGGSRTKLDQ